ncbi:hypothetical protein D3C75_1262140 [compost metagenome]
MGLELLDHGTDLEAEHARVPEIVAGIDIGLSGFEVGLFNEALDLQAAFQRATSGRFDIAEAGFRILWLDAEGY